MVNETTPIAGALGSGRTLILDTATEQLLAGCYSEGQLEREFVFESEQGASALLQKLQEAHFFKNGSYDHLILGTGPGSYTGLRIGFALAGALGLGYKAPLLGISSLAGLASEVDSIVSCFDARAGGVYLQGFYRYKATSEPMRLSDTEILNSQEEVLAKIGLKGQSALWVSPHAANLKKRLGSSIAWQEGKMSAQALWKVAGALSELSFKYPPYQGFELNYLKHESQVAHSPKQ